MANTYLLTYNTLLAAGWGYILFLVADTVYNGGWTAEVYERTSLPLKICQTAAGMEVLHSLLGVVKSPFFTTFIQVLSRYWALWGIVEVAPEAVKNGALKLFTVGHVSLQLNIITLLFCWSATEILRYGFYAAKEVGYVPYPLLWLRYSTFVILYPLGVASEMTMVYLAMPTIRKERPLSFSMPNSINFAFDYYWFCWVAIACYVPGLPELYFHMLRQRKKILGKPAHKAKKTV